MKQITATRPVLKPPRVATDGLFWGVATVMVPITLAFASAFAIAVFEAFRMDDADEPSCLRHWWFSRQF